MRLSSVVVRGSSVYTAPELFATYSSHLGKEVTRASVSSIVASLADRYQADGYTRPQIGVDGTLLAVGVLRLDVSETRIDAVAINGDPGPHRWTLERLGDELKAREPLRQEDLRNALRRMRRLPGLELSAATASDPGAPHAFRLDLDTEFRRVSATARMTNRGTDEIGPHFVLGQVGANGLFGGRMSAGLSFASATDRDEYRGAGLFASADIGRRGSRLTVSAFRSSADPHEPGIDRNLSFVRDRAGIRAALPMPESAKATSVTVGLDATDLTIERSGAHLRDERLRMMIVGVNQTWRSGNVEHARSVEVVKGLGGLDSGLDALDLAVDPRSEQFTLLRLNMIRLARFAPEWSWRLDALAQQTSYALPFTERFKIGGDRLGRGFERAEIAGDQGVGAKLELRRDLPDAPALLGRTSIYGFYDVGATWKQDVPGRESAATAGLGFGLRDEHKTAAVELARPLTGPDIEGRDDVRLFFELMVRW